MSTPDKAPAPGTNTKIIVAPLDGQKLKSAYSLYIKDKCYLQRNKLLAGAFNRVPVFLFWCVRVIET